MTSKASGGLLCSIGLLIVGHAWGPFRAALCGTQPRRTGQVPRYTCRCRFCMERGEHRCVASSSLVDYDRSSMRAPDGLEGGKARLAARG